jgi:transcriptional regulator with XRE-family HTH domain
MEQLKRLRQKKGLSQARLAARAELDPSTVNQIERGMRDASPGTLRKLADALEVSLYELIEEKVPKVQSPLPLEVADTLQRGYLPLSHILEDWWYLIEGTAERHIQNVSSDIFSTVEGANAYSIAAYTELAQLFEICLERISPTIEHSLPESLAQLEGHKLARAMFRLEEAQVAVTKAAEAAGVDLGHAESFSEEELTLIEEAAREFEELPELTQRIQMREAWEIVDRLAKTHIKDARDLAEEVRNRSSA